MKVITVVGTRPEIIRLSRVIVVLERYLQHVLIHTGQNYDFELNQIFFNDLGLRAPDYFLEAAGKSPAETVGLVMARVDEVLASEKPDAVLILGDTNSCLAAYPAKRRKIPVFHMEAVRLWTTSATSTCLTVPSVANISCARVCRRIV
jgi:UDP-N-acetylglucosamine 2-epimerase